MIDKNQVYLITNNELNKLIKTESRFKRDNFTNKYIRKTERESKEIVIEDFERTPHHKRKKKE